MGFEDYLFAIFVFALGGILVLLIVKGIGKNKADRDSLLDEKEKKLDRMYNEVTDLMEALESYIQENREGLRRELETAREYLAGIQRTKAVEISPTIAIEKKPEAEPQTLAAPANKEDLKQKALKLSRLGYSAGDIAQELGLSRGEVNFMLSLSKKTF